jgi:hypothetical protein
MLEFLTNYFLSKVVTNLQMWASENDVIKETGLNKYLKNKKNYIYLNFFSSGFICNIINEKRIIINNNKK